METAEDSRVAALEKQMQELQKLLEEERAAHAKQKEESSAKLKDLEGQLSGKQPTNNSTPGKRSAKPFVPRVASLAPRATTPKARSLATGAPPRTSDNLFATQPNRSAPSRKPKPDDSEAGDEATAEPREASHEAVDPTQQVPTALQASWDKFCFIARKEFTPKELSLVSAETLKGLLDHYKVRSPIERAQIEGQWALLQEGRETVGAGATPRQVRSNARKPIKQAVHDSDFCIDWETRKPHLSKRTALAPEPSKPSNPNNTTSRSPYMRTNSGPAAVVPKFAVPSNPNDVVSRSTPRRYCFARTMTPPPRSETPRGMRHVAGPESSERTPRGIRSNGSTFEGPLRDKNDGIRCRYASNDGVDDSKKRGVRTFDSSVSLTHEHRPSKNVSRPAFETRSTLSTEMLVKGPWPRQRQLVGGAATRAPFATDFSR